MQRMAGVEETYGVARLETSFVIWESQNNVTIEYKGEDTYHVNTTVASNCDDGIKRTEVDADD